MMNEYYVMESATGDVVGGMKTWARVNIILPLVYYHVMGLHSFSAARDDLAFVFLRLASIDVSSACKRQ